MKICSKCNNEVSKGQVYCPKCGFSLVKNTYGERVEFGSKPVQNATIKQKESFKESFNGTKINSKSVAKKPTIKKPELTIFISIFSILLIIGPIFMTITSFIFSNSFDNHMEYNETDTFIVRRDDVISTLKDNDDDIIIKTAKDIDIILNDVITIRELIEQIGDITLDDIASNTSLDLEDLSNTWCTYNSETSGFASNGLICLVTAHKDLGNYESVLAKLNGIQSYIYDDYDGEYYTNYYNVYNALYDLYYLSRNTYDDTNDFNDSYNTAMDTLEYNLNNIDKYKN